MPNDEQVVLDFFSRPENVPLALVAAEHIDGIRLKLNNEFWTTMRDSVDALISKQAPDWVSFLTEDRNNEECLVGMYVQPSQAQEVFLRPFMEQQFQGDAYRIYHGLMWSTTPSAVQKNLPGVIALRDSLQSAGFKEGDSFLAWQWLPWRPRQRDFLMRFATQRETLLQEAETIWSRLLVDYQELIRQANLELHAKGHSAAISLSQMRDQIKSR